VLKRGWGQAYPLAVSTGKLILDESLPTTIPILCGHNFCETSFSMVGQSAGLGHQANYPSASCKHRIEGRNRCGPILMTWSPCATAGCVRRAKRPCTSSPRAHERIRFFATCICFPSGFNTREW